MKTNIIMIIAFGLLITNAKTSLPESEVDNLELKQLIANQDATEENIVYKVHKLLFKKFGVNGTSTNMYTAIKEYLTGGLNSFDLNIDNETEHETTKAQITELTNNFIMNHNLLDENKLTDDDVSNAIDDISSLTQPAIEYNTKIANASFGDKKHRVISDSFSSIIDNILINTIRSHIKSSIAIEKNQAYLERISKFVRAMKQNMNTLRSEIQTLVNNKALFVYANFENNYCIAMHNTHKNLPEFNESTLEIYKTFAKKLFTLYSIVGENKRGIDGKTRENILFFSLKFLDANMSKSSTDDLFKKYFNHEKPLTFDGDNYSAYINNLYFSYYNKVPLTIAEDQVELYVDQYINYKKNFGTQQVLITGFLQFLQPYVNNKEFDLYAMDKLAKFLASKLNAKNQYFGQSFDAYLNLEDKSENTAFYNVLKMVNGIFSCEHPIDTWKVIKLIQSSDANHIKILKDLLKKNFEKDMIDAQEASGSNKDALAYEILNIPNFNRELIANYYTFKNEHQQIDIEEELKDDSFIIEHLDTNMSDVKFNPIDYHSDYNILNGEKDPKSSIKSPYNVEEHQIPTFDRRGGREEVIPVFEDEPFDIPEVAENVIVHINGTLLKDAEDFIKKPELEKRIKQNEKPDSYDDLIYVKVVPNATLCWDQIKKAVIQQLKTRNI